MRLVHLAANLNPLRFVSGDKRFPFHGPAEWFRHGGVEVCDEIFDPPPEMILRREIAAPEQLSDQDREPDFDLVDPRRVLWCEMEGDAVAGVAQECLARCH